MLETVDVTVLETGEILKIPAKYSLSPHMEPMKKNRLQIAGDALAILLKRGITNQSVQFQLEEWDNRLVDGVLQTGYRLNTITYDDLSFFQEVEMERLAG